MAQSVSCGAIVLGEADMDFQGVRRPCHRKRRSWGWSNQASPNFELIGLTIQIQRKEMP